jgi:hypothetical protein
VTLGFSNEAQERATGKVFDQRLLTFSENLLCAPSEILGNDRRPSQQSRLELGWVSALDVEGKTIWIVDAHGYGKRFIVRAEEILTAFLELERAIHEFAVDLIS